MNLEAEVLKLTVCPICSDFIGSPIFQCSAGHHVCKKCMQRTDKCSTCRLPIVKTGIRNRVLEDILSCLASVPCSQLGCDVKGSFREIQDHYDKCTHRHVQCPVRSCTWSGKIMEMHTHVEAIHCDDVTDMHGSEVAMIINNPDGQRVDIYADHIIRTDTGKLFVVSFWVMRGYGVTNSIIGTVTFIGGEVSVGVKSRMTLVTNECDLVCERTPWSLVDDIVPVATSKFNLVLDWELALHSGQDPPIYSDTDHIGRVPHPESMNILVVVKIIDPTSQDDGGTTRQSAISLDFVPLVDCNF